MYATIAPMSEKEMQRQIQVLEKATKKICKTPRTAFEFLLRHGFITKTGKLTKRYGG